ncbi:MAG: hypothetical protein HUK22_05660, partial [Thermoguttaceae bacterium]|nr:hypothetical protein [Thermoguttaceae bacterium]
MEELSKETTTYYLSEYLADLQRAGVSDVRRAPSVSPNAAPLPRTESAEIAPAAPSRALERPATAALPVLPPVAETAPSSAGFDEAAYLDESVDRSERLRLLA